MATPIFHITHVRNLAGIIGAGGLWSDTQRTRRGLQVAGIAHQNIKIRRMRTQVPIGAGGVVADYVPFYFANRSPMMYALHTGYVDGFDGKQADIVHLVSSVEMVSTGDRPWCFTDGHAVEAVSRFFDQVAELDRIDREVISSWSWKDTTEDPDRKRRKQAELLVHEFFPWTWVEAIGVQSEGTRAAAQRLLEQAEHRPAVRVEPRWYY